LSKTKLKFHQTKKFKALSAKWDKKLEAKGFVNAEKETDSKGFRNLVKHGNPYRNVSTESMVVIEAKAEYYRQMEHKSNEETFDSIVDRWAVCNYIDGMTIKDVCLKLEKLGHKRDRSTVRHILRKYEDRWGIKKYVRR
jgi:hypothetical protein